ncbi:MAG TPA: adenylate/guanylate cyclase domain-containing protein [Burkholderiales bacterium]|nr:adenylate/guanylate cyclase domain-containing protein [Burkholderiales bacterium]
MAVGVRGSRAVMTAAYLVVLAAAAAAAYWRLPAALDLKVMDAQMRFLREKFPRPAGNDVVLVGLDEPFLESMREPLALLHPHLARFLAAMTLAKPSVVGLDIVLPSRSYRFLAPIDHPETNYDAILLRALLQTKRQVPVLFAKTWDMESRSFRPILVDYVVAARPAGNSPVPGDADARASVLVCADEDGIVRRFPDGSCQPDGGNYGMAAKLAAYAGNAQIWSGYIDYTIGAPLRYIPLAEVLGWLDKGDEAKLASTFGGRVVLLGPILPFEDRHTVPVELAGWEPGSRHVPGVLIHAQSVRSIMGTGLLQPVAPLIEAAIAALFTLVWWIRRPWLGGTLYVIAAVALVFASTRLMLHGLVLSVVAALIAGVAAAAMRFGVQAVRDAREKKFLKSSFSGSVSPDVLRDILSGRIVPGRADRKRACVLFSDIRGFTRRGEAMPPEKLVSILNRYFSVMTDVVHKHHGTVDKFIGDGMMAVFGAPQQLEHAEQNAMEAAQEMIERLAEVNAELAAQGEEPLKIGIGLHSGEIIVGHIGSRTRHEYTAIGDVVNVAARLEGLSKTAGHVIVCSKAVAQALGFPPMLSSLGEKPVAGHSPQEIYGWNPAVLATA